MADEFRITKEIMQNATTYIPIALKELIASTLARGCVRETGAIRPEDMEIEPDMFGLEPVYCESTLNKARSMMGILLAFYLKLRSDDDSIMCDIDVYDQWAGAHVLNQIERYKAGDMREKAFDLLSDYREMEKMLNSAIYSVLREMNDPVKRLVHSVGAMSNEEALKNAIEMMEQASGGIKDEKERQDKIINGEGVSSDGAAE